jgi:HEAT repeat protein
MALGRIQEPKAVNPLVEASGTVDKVAAMRIKAALRKITGKDTL